MRSVLLALVMTASTAAADVTRETGNYFVGYDDITLQGAFELVVDRNYNSTASSVRGIWGWGWGSELDTFLEVRADGSVALYEYGNGADIWFTRAAATPIATRSTAAVVASTTVAVGAQLVSARYKQRLERTATGFRRTRADGRADLFDERGRIVRVDLGQSRWLAFVRDAAGAITSTEDSAGRKLVLAYTPKGLVSTITTNEPTPRTATYRYDALDQLVASTDTDGNAYRYEYDRKGQHLLTAIRYRDNTSVEIGYYGAAQNLYVASVKDRDNFTLVYSYFTGHSNEELAVEQVDPNGIVVKTERFEYKLDRELDIDAANRQRSTRLARTRDDDRDITYDTACQLPLRIEQGGEVTSLRYDDKCRVTYKDTPSETWQLAYDAATGKLARLDKQAKIDKAPKEWTTFAYDASGQLVDAESSKGKRIHLEYAAARIAAITVTAGTTKRVVRMQYDAKGRAVEIAVEGVGTLRVTYAANGELAKVDSAGGRKVTLAVTTMFQELTDMVRPAGLSLAF